MPTPQELETKFWKSLSSEMTMMLGLDGLPSSPGLFKGVAVERSGGCAGPESHAGAWRGAGQRRQNGPDRDSRVG